MTSLRSLALLAMICACGDAATLAEADHGATLPASGTLAATSAAPDLGAAVARRHLQDRLMFEEVEPGRYVGTGGMRVEVDADGLHVTQGEDELVLSLVRWGRPGALEGLQPVDPTLGGCAADAPVRAPDGDCIRRVEQRYPALVAWTVRHSKSVQQGWTLRTRPAGEGPVRIALAVSGARVVEARGDSARLSSPSSAWWYHGLVARDARGRILPAKLVATANGLDVEVDDRDAVYPVEVDPNLWATEQKITPSDGMPTGHVTGAGDVDADGYDDIAVSGGGSEDHGAFYVFHGSAGGIVTASQERLVPKGSLSGAGDIDGDGYDDVAAGAPWDAENGEESGAVNIWYGSATGLDPETADKLVPSDGAAWDYFGFRVSGAGDIDGDGYDDIVVGARNDYVPNVYEGSAYVYYGSASGIAPESEQKIFASDGSDSHSFGYWVSGAGDANGDGYDDIVVGSPWGDVGASAHVYYGSASGIVPASAQKILASDNGSGFGLAVAGGGDLNGDGYDDIAVGAAWDDDNGDRSGSVYVYYGSASGIVPASEQKIVASDGSARDEYGRDVSVAGDLNADGYDDLVVGGWFRRDDHIGRAYVYYGSASGIAAASEQRLLASDGTAGNHYGYGVSGAGDIDADGYGDLVVGAPGSTSAYVYRGGCNDADLDGICEEDDCDDTNDSVGGPSTWYADADGDGFGDGATSESGCDPSAGYVADATDCDDTNDSVGGPSTWYADADGDGFGDGATSESGCDPSPGYVADATDCDDSDATVHPGADEIAGDGIDQDCDGEDQQGCGGCATGGAAHPGAWLLGLLGLVGLVRLRRSPQTTLVTPTGL